MLKRLNIVFLFLCLTGSAVSFVLVLGDAPDGYFTAEEALVTFLKDPAPHLRASGWFLVPVGFLLCAAFWYWRLLKSKYETKG